MYGSYASLDLIGFWCVWGDTRFRLIALNLSGRHCYIYLSGVFIWFIFIFRFNFCVLFSLNQFTVELWFNVQVLPKEDHARYTWSSILPPCLRRKNKKINLHASGCGMKLEGISLEMKQQEAEAKYISWFARVLSYCISLLCFSHSVYDLQVPSNKES